MKCFKIKHLNLKYEFSDSEINEKVPSEMEDLCCANASFHEILTFNYFKYRIL